MKKFRNRFIVLLVCLMFMVGQHSEIYAGNMWANASPTSVRVGSNFTVTVGSSNLFIEGISVTCSGCTIISGISGSIDKGETKNIVARLNSSAGATVTISGTATDYDNPNSDFPISTSAHVSAATNSGGGSWTPSGGSSSSSSQTTPQTPDPEDDTHSKDNDLKSLSVSEGKLTPEFSKDTTSYNVNLPATAKKITLKAEANDTKATVEGTGEKALEPGDNDFDITVTAENKSVKVYKVKVIVDEKPLMYLKYNGVKLGVVRNVRNAPIPPNFTATTLKIKGKEIPAWKNEAMKKTIVYLMDTKNNKQFYLYENGKVTSTFTYTKLLGREVFLIDIPKAQQRRTSMNYQKLTIENVTVMGWTFNEKSMKDYELIYVMDLDGKCRYYQYEKSQHTIQLYSGAAAVTQSEYTKQVKDLKAGRTAMTYTAVALGLLAAGLGCYVAYLTIRKKKS